jgi:hypothetical protein
MKFKKTLMIIGISALVIMLVGYISLDSYGFFSATDVAKNTFVLGKVEIDLTEPKWDPLTGDNLLPGKTLIKDPTLTEVEGDSFARVILEFLDENGNLITDQARIDLIKQTMYYDTTYNGNTTLNLVPGFGYTNAELSALRQQAAIYNLFNIESYTFDYNKSTYNIYHFLCNGVLTKGDKAVLFSNIVIPLDFTKEDMDLLGDFKLQLRAEAVQSEGFYTREDAFVELDKVVTP